MKSLKALITLTLIFLISSCDTDSEYTSTSGILIVNFNHNWDGESVTPSDFNVLNYTNANDDLLSITKLRYLISDIQLRKSDGTIVELSGYLLVDLTGTTSTIIANVPFENYSGISFTFGFDQEDNIDGQYADLNSTSWNWPEMLGGGYHFMQFEGKYDDNGNESPFAYHMGTAKLPNGEFGQNYFEVNLPGFSVTSDATLNVEMNIAEWFKNPNVWDLSMYNIDLMGNYDAQVMMNQNGQSVFSLGEITQ
ncbi:MbnP family protein [Urechidicola croceus]|uniref:Copper-binding protein MbnP-like domain-containing protein n=1 Tax=Urechidicola croceus TaxID=1850246 RepID=A0A1D8P9Z8_9FLAO|nr:MbnP family protein [Urechidicola croceus]AOW21346.1 hypothetical protein LPB138_11935 [Urechidicola croceus]